MKQLLGINFTNLSKILNFILCHCFKLEGGQFEQALRIYVTIPFIAWRRLYGLAVDLLLDSPIGYCLAFD